MSEKLVVISIDKNLIIGDKLNIGIKIFDNKFSVFLDEERFALSNGYKIETIIGIKTMAYNCIDLCDGVEQFHPLDFVKS